MNTKDVMSLINRRYEKKKDNVYKKYSDYFREEDNKKSLIIEDINKKTLDYAIKELSKHNLELKEDYKKRCFLYDYYTNDFPNMEKLKKQKEEEIEQLNKEKEDLLDSIVVYGIKDEFIKNKIKCLLED